MSDIIRYNREFLEYVIFPNDSILIGEYIKINRDTKITFLCRCGIEHTKLFRMIFKHDALCKFCGSYQQIKKNKNNE